MSRSTVVPAAPAASAHVPLGSRSAGGPRRLGAIALAVGVLTLAGASAAQAHVRVVPESTAAGGFTKLTFRVPNESDTASTTKIAIDLPTDTPLAFVSAQRLEGWTVKVTTGKLPKPVEMEGSTLTQAPTRVTWTAQKGHAVGPGQFQEFAISGGPLPTGATRIAFPAEQTYSDGSVVDWNQPQAAGADEPEHPVPAFDLTAAEAEGGHGAAAGPDPVAGQNDPNSEDGEDSEDGDDTEDTGGSGGTDWLARGLGGAGLVAGLAGLALAVLARRRPATDGSASGGSASDGSPAAGGPAASGSTTSEVGAGSTS